MSKTRKISYKVFLFKRVKKKIKFLKIETYPVHIRFTSGIKTLTIKSAFFTVLRKAKYQNEIVNFKKSITIKEIIRQEEKVIKYIVKNKKQILSPELVRHSYVFYSFNILDELDERFKRFLINFFYQERLPAFSFFIQNDCINYTSEFILNTLEMSLKPDVYGKLLKAAFKKGPPYIPVINFFHQEIKMTMPILPVYLWEMEKTKAALKEFIQKEYSQYKLYDLVSYISIMVGEML